MRIAFDSAILVRANQRATGLARALLLAVLENGHTMVLSASVLDEVGRVLHYPRLLKAYALTGIEISRFVAFLSASAHVVEIDETVAPPIRDPDDVHIIRTAVSGKPIYSVRSTHTSMIPQCSSFVEPTAFGWSRDVEMLALILAQTRDIGTPAGS